MRAECLHPAALLEGPAESSEDDMTTAHYQKEGDHTTTVRCSGWSLWEKTTVKSPYGPFDEWVSRQTCTYTEQWSVYEVDQTCKDEATCSAGYFSQGNTCAKYDWNTHQLEYYASAVTGHHHAIYSTYGPKTWNNNSWTQTNYRFSLENPWFVMLRRYGWNALHAFPALVHFAQQTSGWTGSQPFRIGSYTTQKFFSGDLVDLNLSKLDEVEDIDGHTVKMDGDDVMSDDLVLDESFINTAKLAPGDHHLIVDLSSGDKHLEIEVVIPVEEPISIDLSDPCVELPYGGSAKANSRPIDFSVTNRSSSAQFAHVSLSSAPIGWSATILGDRLFLLEPLKTRALQLHAEISDPAALTRPLAGFEISCTFPSGPDSSRTVKNVVHVNATAAQDLIDEARRMSEINLEPTGEIAKRPGSFGEQTAPDEGMHN
jgi:hypothetical protein